MFSSSTWAHNLQLEQSLPAVQVTGTVKCAFREKILRFNRGSRT